MAADRLGHKLGIFIRAYCPVVEFGLVGATAHVVNEHVSIADIEALTETYGAILEQYLRQESITPILVRSRL